MIAVFALEALTRPDHTFFPERLSLFRAVREGGFQTAFLTSMTQQMAHSALRQEQVEYDLIFPRHTDDDDWKAQLLVTRLLAASFRVTFYVDDDPVTCAQARVHGISTLLLEGRVAWDVQAEALRRTPVSWDQITA